jgi:competence protein ComFC
MLANNINFSNLFKVKKSLICDHCARSLEKVNGGCSMCGKKTKEVICPDCLYWEGQSLKIKNYSLFYYNELGKNIINQIKFNGNCKVLNTFYNQTNDFFVKKITNDFIIIPVPLHSERLAERGFNQSLYIANMLPFKVIDVIDKVNNDKQSKKNRHERLNLNNFRFKSNVNLENKKIIIVDDIYTTGATIHHIGKIILSKKAKEVISFTLFRS